MLTFIVTDRAGLKVYPFMNLLEVSPRAIQFGDSVTIYETFYKSATQFWGRINADNIKPLEYVCISIASRKWAELHPTVNENAEIKAQWYFEVDAWLRSKGYIGTTPF